MSNRKALRELSAFLPAPKEVEQIMDGLKGESDRSAVILSGSLLDIRLRQIIEAKLVYKNKQLSKHLFDNNGPLSNFSYKISIASAFGIITPPMADELNSIRAVRNAFAHSVLELTFKDKIITKEVNSLRMITAMRNTTDSLGVISERDLFLLVVRILLIMFDELEKHDGLADSALAEALNPATA